MDLNTIILTTNPISKKYFTFLATVNKWLNFVSKL